MKKQKLLNSICLATAISLSLSLFPVELHAESSTQEEKPELPEEKPSEKTETPEIEIKNTFNGCKEIPVKLSISCKKSDEFTFDCKDNCRTESKYTGYSSIQTGEFLMYSKNYELKFNNAGEHIISAYKNEEFLEFYKIIIADTHSYTNTGKTYCGEQFKCEICGNYQEENHACQLVVTREATCKTKGERKLICSKCSYSKVVDNPKGYHIPGDWKVVKAPTIFKSGKEQISCIYCGEVWQERIISKLKSSVNLSKNKIKIKAGKTYKLSIKKKSTGDTVSNWKSSKKSVATINSKGKIKAKKKGKATITVKMKSGCTATCTVTVK